MRKRFLWIVAGVVCIVLAVGLVRFFYAGRPSDLSPKEGFDLVAHRGVHTMWKEGTYDRATGCEAVHIYEPTHQYLENTIESMAAAFELGATLVEIDIRRSRDGHLVILHDDALECRTNGQGNVGDHPLAYLQSLDIGYGYTADGGKTYPLRGMGVGRMPTLPEVLETFPDRRFLIDHKDGSMQTAELLVDILQDLPPEQQALVYYWGPEEAYAYVHDQVPAVTRFFGQRSQVKRCLLPYLATLGLSGIPEDCQGLGVGLPVEYIKLAWGWPYRFLKGLSDASLRFYLMVDSEEDARAYADIPADGVVTDWIQDVAPHYRDR
jgi:glycerophosphoryl diester phosphodiesterase